MYGWFRPGSQRNNISTSSTKLGEMLSDSIYACVLRKFRIVFIYLKTTLCTLTNDLEMFKLTHILIQCFARSVWASPCSLPWKQRRMFCMLTQEAHLVGRGVKRCYKGGIVLWMTRYDDDDDDDDVWCSAEQLGTNLKPLILEPIPFSSSKPNVHMWSMIILYC